MKIHLALITLYFILIQPLHAQTGDFELTPSQQRPYVKITADSSLLGNGFKRLMIGRNYRGEWTEPVRVPMISFKTDFGGLVPGEEGGGKQTHTLHLKDGNGQSWNLRSVQKFPEKVLAPELKGTIAETLVSDGISASYPYGVLSVGTLAKAAGVPFLPNTVVYIPDDTALGALRSKYKNTIALLELKKPGDKKEKDFDTEEIILELFKGKKAVDQEAVLRARLLDNFIGDFDRHEGQWSWLERDTAGKKYYFPVPKDRDQAFFRGEGLLIKKISKIPSLGQLQGFKAHPKNVLTFNYAARNFDNSFLNELDATAWSTAIDRFLSAVTDSVIEDALHRQPKEIQGYRTEEIINILKEKKQIFKADMMRYYRFLSRRVSVLGTNGDDLFSVKKNDDGSIEVTVTQVKDSVLLYKRLFDAATTKEIRIFGLEGNDRFLVDGAGSPIKLRFIGGPGNDVFTSSAQEGKALVYDVSFEKNTLEGKGLKNKISSDPLNNVYQRITYEYNSSSIGLKPEYARDGGLFLGLRYTATTTSFRKEPYASRHLVYLTKALANSAWHFHYDGDFLKIAKNTDLLFRSDAMLPTVRTNFLGYGNSTVLDKHINPDYYLIQYTLVEASLMARHSLASWFQLSWGPLAEYFKLLKGKNEDHYIASLPSSPSNDKYAGRWYGGGEIRAIVNTKNNQLIPTRGISFNAYARRYVGLSDQTNDFSQVGGDFSFYTDFIAKNRVVLANDFGAHGNFDRFQIPQAQYLGFKQNLRGYRYQRFAGKARAYNNTEVRVNFGDVNLYLFKGPLGILAFHDVGRVWVSGEESDTWHTGYGGGVWIAPFKKMVLTGMLTSSKEENVLPMLIFGFQF